VRRREFIALLSGVAALAWPFAAVAQHAMPVIGFLHPTSPDAFPDRLRAFRQGLKETGYVEGENVIIRYRFGENQIDRLSAMAGDLVTSGVAVIAAANSPPALAAKAATTTIPVVFITPEDPVRLGLVTSLAKPGGNLTGINLLSGELAAKRLELLRQLVPRAARVAVLVNPANPSTTETTLRDVEAAARSMGLQTQVLRPALAMRSMQPSQSLRRSNRIFFSLVVILFSPAGVCNSPCSRRITQSRRPPGRAKSPKPED